MVHYLAFIIRLIERKISKIKHLRLNQQSLNKMIFAIQRHEKIIALIMFEDCQRKGELMRDFAFLYPQYYSSEKEWDDHRNLIVASIFPLVKKSIFLKIKDDLEYLAESMIEYKPAVNHKIQFCNDSKVKQYYAERNEQKSALSIICYPFVKTKKLSIWTIMRSTILHSNQKSNFTNVKKLTVSPKAT